MNGLIALVGAGEYLPVMEDVDRRLLASVKVVGRAPRVVCLPTAAGQEGSESIRRWSRMGEKHFKALGADVTAVPIIDKDSANDPQYGTLLESADLIYFSGGNPNYLFQTMNGSKAWDTAQKAWAHGAAYAGCSAGAMILAKRIPNFRMPGTNPASGFGISSATYVLPHFDAMPAPFKVMVNLLRNSLKEKEFVLGIDEDTALIGKTGGEWKVMGENKVHVLTRKSAQTFSAGEIVPLA
ncbi:MAG: Type 1 glutamine amidotransferase-like domain-containing protein [Chloroflexi bacterium]|nr:Type 1 glutamine amidotransferase-like domain-containing protein [Chloroflexota bacterium]